MDIKFECLYKNFIHQCHGVPITRMKHSFTINPLYPIDVYTRRKFWCSYIAVDVYTCHSHMLVLCALFT